MNKCLCALLPVALVWLTPPAAAQPADAKAPALRYQSAFADYKPWQELAPADWRALNDQLRDASRGAGHGGPMAPPAPAATTPALPAPSAAAPTPKPASALPGHGHPHHGGAR